jgi:hypothetical protein
MKFSPQAAGPSTDGGLRKTFGTCAGCAASGTGGALLSHIGCAAALLVGGATGAAFSSHMMPAMIIASPAIAAGATAIIDYCRKGRVSLPKVAASAAIGGAVAFGLHAYMMSGDPLAGLNSYCGSPPPASYLHHALNI